MEVKIEFCVLLLSLMLCKKRLLLVLNGLVKIMIDFSILMSGELWIDSLFWPGLDKWRLVGGRTCFKWMS